MSGAFDGITILVLGAAVGYLYTVQSTPRGLLETSVSHYREAQKPPANRPTPAEIRESHDVCPVKEANLADSTPADISKLKEAREKQQKVIEQFDDQSGAEAVPPPPLIQGVFLESQGWS